MTIDQLRDILLEQKLIKESARPNASHQFVAKCYNCDKPKLYIAANENEPANIGVHMCQSCQTKGNAFTLHRLFSPLTEEQEVFKTFHEYTVRQLLDPANGDTLKHLITDRDFTEEDITEYGWGYAGKHMVDDLLELGLTMDQLVTYGIVGFNEDTGDHHAVFWDHITIPYRRSGEYVTFKGRNMDPNAKVKYISLIGRKPGLYGSEDLKKKGRVFMTEGEFKRAYMKSAGYNSTGVSGVGNFQEHLSAINEVEDLWIVFDSDPATEKYPQGCGQMTAAKLAVQLNRCHVVTLPLSGDKKIGIDDYLRSHGNDDFNALCETADYYENGEKKKPQALAVVIDLWAQEAIKRDKPIGYQIGYERLNSITRGFFPGSLIYLIGAPHNGKTAILRNLCLELYLCNPELMIDLWSNDDSLRETLPHFVASLAQLNATDCAEPTVAFAERRRDMIAWQKAVAELQAMSSRLKILDRSYSVPLEDIYENMMRWREANPEGHRVLMVDGFRKLLSLEAQKFDGNDNQMTIKKSDQLKRIAQEANIPVISTIEPPKLNGRRPRSFDIANSAMGEFDATVIIGCYIEAQYEGIDGTDLKMTFDYEEDDVSEIAPLIEADVMKNKQTGDIDKDIFVLRKRDSALLELDDDAYVKHKRNIIASESGEKKKEKNAQGS